MVENKINSPNISTDEIQQIDGGKIYSLSIGTLLEFNQTTVECVAVFFDERPALFTPAVTLLIQGLMNAHVITVCNDTHYHEIILPQTLLAVLRMLLVSETIL